MRYAFALLLALIATVAWSQKASAVESAGELAKYCQRLRTGHQRRGAAHPNSEYQGGATLLGIHASDTGSVSSRLRGRNQDYGSCPPEQTTVLQLIRSFVTYARSHPAELEGNTAVAVFKALQHAFPCR